MRIRMLKTIRGSDDGHTVRDYVQGMEYDLSATPRARELATVLLKEEWAEQVVAKPPPVPVVVLPPPAPEAPAPAPVEPTEALTHRIEPPRAGKHRKGR